MRIKHNDLTHWFIRDHDQLPRAYLRKCEKFFQSIQDRLITKKDAEFLFKHQAASNSEPQATSNKQQATSNKLRQNVQFKKKFKKFIIGELTKGEI